MTVTLDEPERRLRSDGLRTREAILSAAMALATVDGLDRLTIGGLADHIGMSKSGLFAHFRSKEALQLATVSAARVVYDDEVVAPALAEAPGLATVIALVDRFLDHLERRTFPGGCFFASTSAELRMRPGPVTSALVDFDTYWLGLFRRHLSLAVERGELVEHADIEQLLFEIDSHMVHAHLRFSARSDERALAHARVAVRQRLGVDAGLD
jgi:AcrR family transcriptional regulator